MELKAGQKYEFTPTGSVFEIAKVGVKNVSWYVAKPYKGGNGTNTMSMAYVTIKRFEEGVAKGTYKQVSH